MLWKELAHLKNSYFLKKFWLAMDGLNILGRDSNIENTNAESVYLIYSAKYHSLYSKWMNKRIFI